MDPKLSESIVEVRVIPRARRSELVDWSSGGRIKARVTAPPLDGKANTELIRLLAKILKIKKSQIEIVSGWKSRNKLVRIIGFRSEELDMLFEALLCK